MSTLTNISTAVGIGVNSAMSDTNTLTPWMMVFSAVLASSPSSYCKPFCASSLKASMAASVSTSIGASLRLVLMASFQNTSAPLWILVPIAARAPGTEL